jgi:glutamine synthetase
LPERRHGVLTVEDLRHLVDHGEVDTVLVAITDMQGRLQG